MTAYSTFHLRILRMARAKRASAQCYIDPCNIPQLTCTNSYHRGDETHLRTSATDQTVANNIADVSLNPYMSMSSGH